MKGGSSPPLTSRPFLIKPPGGEYLRPVAAAAALAAAPSPRRRNGEREEKGVAASASLLPVFADASAAASPRLFLGVQSPAYARREISDPARSSSDSFSREPPREKAGSSGLFIAIKEPAEPDIADVAVTVSPVRRCREEEEEEASGIAPCACAERGRCVRAKSETRTFSASRTLLSRKEYKPWKGAFLGREKLEAEKRSVGRRRVSTTTTGCPFRRS